MFAKACVTYSPESVVIVVSNPLDAMAYVAMKVFDFPRVRVIGMAGVLDGARFRSFIAEEVKCSVKDVHAFVLGGHGDTMVPMPRHCSVGGVPLLEILPKERVDALVKRTREGGAEIVGLLKTGSADYAPSASAVQNGRVDLARSRAHLALRRFPTGRIRLEKSFCRRLVQTGRQGLGAGY